MKNKNGVKIMYGVEEFKMSDKLFSTKEEAVKAFIDNYIVLDSYFYENYKNLFITICQYKRKEVSFDHKILLYFLLEFLDEKFSRSDENGTFPSRKMIADSEEFCKKILEEYEAKDYEATGAYERVNFIEWVSKHSPPTVSFQKEETQYKKK